jgi:hypothetical protein
MRHLSCATDLWTFVDYTKVERILCYVVHGGHFRAPLHPCVKQHLRELYPSQTKILEGLTKEEIRIFEALLKGVSTRFGLRTIAKYIENLDFLFCQSFQNLRLGSINYPRRIGRAH